MTAVVEGGTDLDVATAIYDNRGIGCNTQAASSSCVILMVVIRPPQLITRFSRERCN